MRGSLKRVITFFLFMILGVLSIARIMYVNSEQYVRQTYTYKVGETFEYNGFQVRMEADIYSADDLKSMYQEIPEEVLAENEIMIRTEVKNMADEEQTFNLTTFTLQIGMEYGGSVDPYVYPYLNPGVSGNIVLGKEETKTVMLAFPIEKDALEAGEQIKLILALYPVKYEIVLRENVIPCPRCWDFL